MKVLVLGGRGFIGRYAVRSLLARGHEVTIGTRTSRFVHGDSRVSYRTVSLHKVTRCIDWCDIVKPYDTVINCVGILRPRWRESYDEVHHWAPYRLAKACAVYGKRFIHVSALGLSDTATSEFIRSKLAGEIAIAESGADYSIVRPSILDADDGFGARWIRRVANARVQWVPSCARGMLAPLAVEDLGEALARLAETSNEARYREIELGGRDERTMGVYLRALRGESLPNPLCIELPSWFVRAMSHVCDLFHVTPLSWAHVQLMRRDNRPEINLLPELLGREPKRVGRLWVCPVPGRGAPPSGQVDLVPQGGGE
jgi:NADH dehydrogenase